MQMTQSCASRLDLESKSASAQEDRDGQSWTAESSSESARESSSGTGQDGSEEYRDDQEFRVRWWEWSGVGGWNQGDADSEEVVFFLCSLCSSVYWFLVRFAIVSHMISHSSQRSVKKNAREKRKSARENKGNCVKVINITSFIRLMNCRCLFHAVCCFGKECCIKLDRSTERTEVILFDGTDRELDRDGVVSGNTGSEKHYAQSPLRLLEFRRFSDGSWSPSLS